ncbi:MAG: hypothetical protein NT085_00995 [candidate division SR1 bacterium]|nr:hypothetical protein [candidate division SR1 bacterium]
MKKEVKQNEISDLDFNNLDAKQAEMLQYLLKVIASRVVQNLENTPEDNDKVTTGCMCGQCTETITINQLIDKTKILDSRGLENMIEYMKVIFMIEDYRQKAYMNSWKYKFKQWWKRNFHT